ncbi:hypothetical protein CCF60_003163 [Salmonella enterica subsp. enterica serovar Berkeley]|nr:hypothetical protein [Salmonella enterica subsp. enterica serovar Berkeley]
MKLAFAQEINFTGRGKSPAIYQKEIKQRFEGTGLVFSGFVLPWAAGNTLFRLVNEETQEYKDYALRKLKVTNGGELFQTEKAVTIKLTQKCAIAGKEFVCIVGEWKGRNHSEFSYRCPIHDEHKTAKVNHALKDSYSFDCIQCQAEKSLLARRKVGTLDELRIAREEVINSLCAGTPYKFVRWHGEQAGSNNTVAEFKCEHHGNWRTFVKQVCDRKSLICPVCLSAIKAASTGKVQLKRVKEMKLPVYLYVQSLTDNNGKERFIKFGFSVNPEDRMKHQQRKSAYNHRLVFTHRFNQGWQALDVELGIHQSIKGKKAKEQDVPDGWTETRPASKLNEVLAFIQGYIESDPVEPLYVVDENDFWASIGNDPISEDELEAALKALEAA